MILQMFLSFAVLAGVPRIAQVSPDVRSGTVVWIAGDGFTNGSVLYENAVTVKKENLADQVKNILATSPPIKWNDKPATAQVFDDKVIGASPPIEQNGAYCTAIAIQGPDKSISATYYVNKPAIYGIAGADPSRLYYGVSYPIIGRHLAATRAKPTVWLVRDKEIYQLPLNQPGGRGTGNTRDLDRSTLWVTIPDSVPKGNYLLFAFQGENRYGISDPIMVNVAGSREPWTTTSIVDVVANSGQDITTWLAAAVATRASENDPLILRLRPGVFYVSSSIEIPSHIGIMGSGINTTRIVSSASSGDYSKPSERIPANEKGRSGMFRITGDNVRFEDLTIELTPNSVQSAIVAGTGIDRIQCRRVRFENLSPESNEHGYTRGTIHRFGLWRYWKFEHCEWRCQTPFDANVGPLNGWANNGAADNCLVLGGSFESIYGRSSGSLFGGFLGRSSLIQGLDLSRSRRGLVFAQGDGLMESVVSLCNFGGMLSEIGNGETFLSENRSGLITSPSKVDGTTFLLDGDTLDRTRWQVVILDGPGKYQYRTITSSNNGTHTVESPWEIPPDTTSTFLLTQCPTDCTWVWNRFQDCVGGVNLYGNSLGNVVASNWLRGSREGILLNTNWNSVATSGYRGQAGDGRSIAWFGSYTGNTIEGAGFHFIAARSTDDFVTFKHPQIAFQSIAWNTYLGDVSNQLWAAVGLEQSPAKAPLYESIPLIDFISATRDSSLSGRPYLHKVIDRAPLPRNVWYRTPSNVGNFILRNHSVDNKPISDSASLITTNPENN